MPTYTLRNDDSDLSGGADFDKDLVVGTVALATIQPFVAASSTEDSFGYTQANIPNSATWDTGNWTVEISVSTANIWIYFDAAVARVDSSGTQQEITSFAGEQQADKAETLTFSFTDISWSGGDAGDRIRVTYRIRNNNSHAVQAAVIETGTVETEIVSPVVESPLDTGVDNSLMMMSVGI